MTDDEPLFLNKAYMFLPSFLAFKLKHITAEEVEWNRKKCEMLYAGNETIYYSKSPSFDFKISKKQLLTLLDFIIKETNGVYPLFKRYRKQIDKLTEISPDLMIEAGLHWAKKNLEEHLWFICNHRIRPELLNDYEVGQCAVGAASNLNMALRHFSATGVETALHASKEALLRGLVQAFVSEYQLSPLPGNEVHYVNAYFNYLASEYGCEEQDDKFAPEALTLENLDNLSKYVTEHFTLNAFLERVHFLFPSLPRQAFDASDALLYGSISDYAQFFGPSEAKRLKDALYLLYDYIEEEILIDGKNLLKAKMIPIEGFNASLDALIVEQLCRANVIAFVTLEWKNAVYLFNGTLFLKVSSKADYSLLDKEEEKALQDQLFLRLLGRHDKLQECFFTSDELLKMLDDEHLIYAYQETFKDSSLLTLHEKCFLHIMQRELSFNLYFQTIFEKEHQDHIKHSLQFAEALLSHPHSLTEEVLSKLVAFLKKEEPNELRTCILKAYSNNALLALTVMIKNSQNLFDCNERIDAERNTLMIKMAQAGQVEVINALLTQAVAINQANLSGVTPLIMAAEWGHLEIVQALLEKGANSNQSNTVGATPLFLAAQSGHWGIVKTLLTKVNDVNQSCQQGITPLILAAKSGQTEIVGLLLEKGANVNQVSRIGTSALLLASQNGHTQVVKLLLAKGAEVNHVSKKGLTPLLVAASAGHLATINELLSAGVKVDKANSNGLTPLYLAAQKGFLEIVQALIAFGADVNQANKDGLTPLYTATENNRLAIIKVLLEHGAAVNQASIEGDTPLHVATEYGFLEASQLLLAENADVNCVNKSGESPLFIAAEEGHLELVNALLMHKAAIDQKTLEALTPLYIAVEKGYESIVIALMTEGANLNQADAEGVTPLILAINYDYLDIVKLLLAKGAIANQADKQGVTPLFLAAYKGNVDIVKSLLAYDVDINQITVLSETALFIAAVNGHDQVIEALLQAGAAVNQARNYATPLLMAAQNGYEKAVKMLLSYGADVHLGNQWGATPLIRAAQNGRVEVVNELLAAGAGINAMDNKGTALFSAASRGHANIVEILLKNGAAINQGAEMGSPLFAAAKNGNLEVVQILLKHAAAVNQSCQTATPLFVAAQNGHESIVKELLLAGASITDFESTSNNLIKFAQNYCLAVQSRMMDWIAHQGDQNIKMVRLPQEKKYQITYYMKPYEIAAIMGNDEIAKLIQSFYALPSPPIKNIHRLFSPLKQTDNDKGQGPQASGCFKN